MTTATATRDALTALVEDALRTRPGDPGRVADLRRAGREAFACLGLPTPRQEEWRFTNLKRVGETAWRPSPSGERARVAEVVIGRAFAGSHRLAFVNGRLMPELSSLGELPEGVTVGRLADLPERLYHDALGALAEPGEHAVAALNAAAFSDAAVIHLARGAVLDAPVHVLFTAAPGDAPSASFPRLLVVAGPSSQATLVESYVGVDGEALTVPVTELRLADNAVLDHVRVQDEPRSSTHLGVLQVHLERSATLTSHAFSLGAGLARLDVGATLAGEGADCTLNGLYVVEGTQHVDTAMRVRHAAPHTSSHELYKGVLDGAARGVFTGRIVVDPGAQKTDAKQTNRNLLLSPTALANSNPQLEIFADDVRCTHGSTVGRLDQDAVFYLRSRGIDRAAAESLLTWAFASDLVTRVKVEPVRVALEEFLFRRLPQGELVREAV